MPFYEYKCEKCEKTFEILQKMGATEADTPCPHCKSDQVKRLFSPFSSSSSSGQSSTKALSPPTGGCGGNCGCH